MKRCSKKIFQDFKNYAGLILVIGAVLAGMNVLFHTTCPSMLFLGLPCPGCGITRALCLLLTGHPVEAFRMNPSLYVWLAFFGYMGFYRYIREERVPHLSVILSVVFILALVIYCLGMWKYFPNTEPYLVKSDNLLAKILPNYRIFLKKF